MADDETLCSQTTKRSRKGCQTCRNRKKKCDEVHPECGGCVRNSLSCQWPLESQLQQPRRRRRRQNGHLWTSGIDIPQDLDTMIVVFAVPSRKLLCRLLSHFTQFSPQWMSISPGQRRNKFLSHVMPLALENPLTLNCILAASAADLMKYDIEQPELRTMALELYGKAIAGLSAAVSRELAHGSSITAHAPASGATLIDDILLAVLLLCVHETHNFSDTSRLLPHLNAAAVLLQQRLQFVPPNPELRMFLLEIFCYFFALTAFSHGPSLAITPAAQIFELLPLKSHNIKSQSLLLGPSQDLIVTIFRVSALTMHSAPCMPMDDTRRSELTNLESQLQNWHRSVPIENTMMVESDKYENSDDDMAMFELYRLACLAYIKSTLDPQASPRNPSLQNIVTSFVNELGSLPNDSPANGLLVWPLVVIGLCAVVSSHQRIIIGRLRAVHNTWRSDIFVHNMKLLRDRWKKYRELEELYSKMMNTHHTTAYETLSSYFPLRDLHFPAVLV